MPRISIKDLDATEKGIGSDMNLYFNHTFLRLVQPNKEPRWVRYHGFNGDGHDFQFSDGHHEIVPTRSSVVLDWWYPTGWFNMKKSAAYFERLPKRQYQKGLSFGQNIQMRSAEAIAKELGMLHKNSLDTEMEYIMMEGKYTISLDLLESIFQNPVYPSLEESYVAIKSKKAFCRALNKDLLLIPSPTNSDCLVLCHQVPIAQMVTKSKVQVMLQEFKPECSAYFQKQGVSVV
jgi:hypothetical protein